MHNLYHPWWCHVSLVKWNDPINQDISYWCQNKHFLTIEYFMRECIFYDPKLRRSYEINLTRIWSKKWQSWTVEWRTPNNANVSSQNTSTWCKATHTRINSEIWKTEPFSTAWEIDTSDGWHMRNTQKSYSIWKISKHSL